MIWADRLGICLGLLWVLWRLAATDTIGPNGDYSLTLLVIFVLAPWLLCRFLHFIFTGRMGPRGNPVP